MATDHAVTPAQPAPDTPEAAPTPVRTSRVVMGSAALGLAVILASISGDFAVIIALLVAAAFGFIALLTGFRNFVHFFVAACVLRPVVDLTAGPRSSGVSITEAFGFVVLAVMLLWLLVNRRILVRRLDNALALSLIGIVVVYALATLGSADPVVGFSSTLRMAAGVTVYFVVDLLLVTRRLSMRDLVVLIFTVSVIPLLYPFLAPLGVQVTHQKDGFTALKSVFFLSNNLAHFLVPLLVIGAAWVLRTTGWHRVAALGFCSVVGIELLLSQTRGAWLGAAVGVLIVCLLLDRRIVVLGIAATLAAALLVPPVNSRIVDLAPEPDNPYDSNSLTWRLDQWQRVLPGVETAPVLGGGPGQAVRKTGKEAHNDYVKALVETGLVGLIVYVWFVVASMVASWQALARVRRISRARPRAPAAAPLVEATFAGIFAYSVAAAAAASGENLIDNITFLWSALPLFALAQWARNARPRRLGL